MKASRQYWLLTGLLLAGALYALQAGFVGWALIKFPALQVQVITVGVIAVFLHSYVVHGYGAAKLLSLNEHALLAVLENRDSVREFDKTAVAQLLAKAKQLRGKGVAVEQRDFSELFKMLKYSFEDKMNADIERIDKLRTKLLFTMLFFTVVAIVQGFASQLYPTNAEESKLFSFNIISALGYSYVPAAECLGASIVLLTLSHLLQDSASTLTERFGEVLYEATFLGHIDVENNALADFAPAIETRRHYNGQAS